MILISTRLTVLPAMRMTSIVKVITMAEKAVLSNKIRIVALAAVIRSMIVSFDAGRMIIESDIVTSVEQLAYRELAESSK